MEQLCSTLEFTHSDQVIGENNQVLQVLLKRNDGIVFKRPSLFYSSSSELEETLYHEVNILYHSLVESNENKNNNAKVKEDNLIRLKNVQNNIEYLGLLNGGKIMKIIPSMYNNLVIRYDCLLAFSDTVDLVEDSDIKRRVELFRKGSFLMQGKENPVYYLLNARNSKILYDSLSFVDLSVIKDYLYLSNENTLIEKRLGKGEQIIIKNNSLILFEKSVTTLGIFENENKKVQYVKPNEYLIVEGPGLIIFEVDTSALKKEETIKRMTGPQQILWFLLLSFLLGGMDLVRRGIVR